MIHVKGTLRKTPDTYLQPTVASTINTNPSTASSISREDNLESKCLVPVTMGNVERQTHRAKAEEPMWKVSLLKTVNNVVGSVCQYVWRGRKEEGVKRKEEGGKKKEERGRR